MIYVWRDGKLVDKSTAPPKHTQRSHQVMRDIEPCVSPVDNTVIGSRTDRREHNRRNQVIDCGDDRTVFKPKPDYRPRNLGQDIKRAIQELRNG